MISLRGTNSVLLIDCEEVRGVYLAGPDVKDSDAGDGCRVDIEFRDGRVVRASFRDEASARAGFESLERALCSKSENVIDFSDNGE